MAAKNCQVNKKLVPVKLTYFFELGAVACLFPYLGVYMRTIGLTYSETSIIYGLSPFVSAVLRTVAGMLADKLKAHRVMLLVCCLASGVAHGLLLITPKPDHLTASYALCNLSTSLTYRQDAYHVDMCRQDSGRVCVNGGNCSSQGIAPPLLSASACMIRCHVGRDVCLEAKQTGNDSVLQIGSCVNKNESVGLISLHQVQLDSINVNYGPSTNCTAFALSSIQYNDILYNKLTSSMVPASDLDSCWLSCETTSPELLGSPCPEASEDESVEPKPYQKTFWFFLVLFILGQIFYTPVFSLIDAMVYAHLGEESGKWGVQRLWGTVGFAVFAIVSGLIMDLFADLRGGDSGKNFTFCFIGFAVLSSVGGLMVLCYKISTDIVSASVFKNLGELLSRFEVIVLLINIFLYGAYTGLIEVFLYVRLDELGAPKLLMGLCMVINCIPEIAILLFAGKIISRVGTFGCLCIVFAAYAIRLIAYAFLQHPWLVLLFEPLHSITFGLMYATVSGYGNEITPPGMQGTIQSVIGALYFGFGKGVGSLVSGQIYQHFGAFATFLGFGLSSVAFLVLYILAYYLVIRKKEQKAKKAEVSQDEKEPETEMLKPPNEDNTATKSAEDVEKQAEKEEQEDLLRKRNATEPQIA